MYNHEPALPDFLTVPQVAKRLQLGTAKVYGMARSKATCGTVRKSGRAGSWLYMMDLVG